MGCFPSKTSQESIMNSNVPIRGDRPNNQQPVQFNGHRDAPARRLPIGNDEHRDKHGYGSSHDDRFPKAAGPNNRFANSPGHHQQPPRSVERVDNLAKATQREDGSAKSSISNDDKKKFFDDYQRNGSGQGRFGNKGNRSSDEDDQGQQAAGRQGRFDNPRRFDNAGRSPNADPPSMERGRRLDDEARAAEEQVLNAFLNGGSVEQVLKGVSLDTIIGRCRRPPAVEDGDDNPNKNFLIPTQRPTRHSPPSHYDPTNGDDGSVYIDRWDDDHVQMPCSPMYMARDRKPVWTAICEALTALKYKCGRSSTTVEDLKEIIGKYGECYNDMAQLENLISKIYRDSERSNFLFRTLPRMCDLVLNLKSIFPQPPELLRIGSNKSVTFTQEQAAALLACAFFCLFPYRSERSKKKSFTTFPHPNFERLYQAGSPEKTEKLKCLLHYFNRVTEKMPTGFITFKRFRLPKNRFPRWNESKKPLCTMHLTTASKIEDIESTLQVDFANKWIGGGVLGNGCVQEEIRFTICPEMIVSLLVCEVMQDDECIFLIGCERYSTYDGYASSFKFAGDYVDKTVRDESGRKWCHVVAMDAIFFRERTEQYQIKYVERELLKAYVSFYPQGKGPDSHFGIATGNWGCGAFNGDRELKAIIQLMAASEAERPLVYASFGDKSLVESFDEINKYLMHQRATVGDLYWYIHRYLKYYAKMTLFEYIRRTPVASLRS